MDEPAAAARPTGRTRRTRRPGLVLRVIRAAVLPVSGLILLGLGLSGVHNAHVLATRGVLATAQVTATSGYGRDTIQVGYLVNGKTEHGTINTTATYQLGEPLLVVYDPDAPTVVGAAGTAGSATSAWSEIVVGCVFLATVPAAFAISVTVNRRRRRRSAQALTGP